MKFFKQPRCAVCSAVLLLAVACSGWPAIVSAVGPTAGAAVRSTAGYWKTDLAGEATRLPGDLQGLGSSPVGSVAVHDLGNDGISEIVSGSGFDLEPSVGIFRGDGSQIARFAVYDPGMKQGVNVAAGDVDGDGRVEIITGTRPGAAAHVLIFDGYGRTKAPAGGFFPLGREFRGGTSVAAGDVDGDGTEEIITAAGPGGGPRILVWKKPFFAPADDFLAFDEKMSSGVNVAAGDVDGDGIDEILAVPAGRAEPFVKIFKAAAAGSPFGEFKAAAAPDTGLNIVADDLNGDKLAEIIVAPNGSGPEQVWVYDRLGKLLTSFPTGSTASADGSLVAVGRLNIADARLVLSVPADRGAAGRPTEPRSIAVDVAAQRLRANEYGREVRSFPVSTGTKKYPTPTGSFSVLAKIPKVLYRWSYGPDNPDNYDLGRVPWNLLVMPHIYIHYAPWHNNFGHRMSHGCVNVDKVNAEWIYGWAAVGAPVDIK